jgi:lipase chaperone LimK
MNLKPFVNNKDLYEDFLQYLDEAIELKRKTLEQSTDLVVIHQTQGAIATLRKLKTLKEQVNG